MNRAFHSPDFDTLFVKQNSPFRVLWNSYNFIWRYVHEATRASTSSLVFFSLPKPKPVSPLGKCMPEAIAAIIYGALLSSRSSAETCSSSCSTVKVILDGMRTGPVNASRPSRHFSKRQNSIARNRSSLLEVGVLLNCPRVRRSA